MIFITVFRWRKKPTKALTAEGAKLVEQMVKSESTKILGWYWTLGRCDVVLITEGKDEKAAMKALIRFGDMFSMETMVALTREEAIKLVE